MTQNNDGRKIQAMVKDYKVTIDLDELVDGLDEEELRQLIQQLGCSDRIIKKVCDYLCEEDEEGWWSGGSARLRQEFLERVEKAQLERMPTYNWPAWDDVRQRLKDINAQRQLYWWLYHDIPERLRHDVQDAMRRAGIEVNYTTKQAEEDINRVEQIVRDGLAAMRKDGKQ